MARDVSRAEGEAARVARVVSRAEGEDARVVRDVFRLDRQASRVVSRPRLTKAPALPAAQALLRGAAALYGDCATALEKAKHRVPAIAIRGLELELRQSAIVQSVDEGFPMDIQLTGKLLSHVEPDLLEASTGLVTRCCL